MVTSVTIGRQLSRFLRCCLIIIIIITIIIIKNNNNNRAIMRVSPDYLINAEQHKAVANP